MKIKLVILYILTNFLFSCNSNNENVEYVAITNFNLDTTQLNEREPVKLLYCSSKNNKNIDREYLIQFVAIRTRNHDTINILAFSSKGIKYKSDGNNTYYCIPNENRDNILKLANIEIEKIKNSDIEHLNESNLIMVIQDKKHSEIENNNYPTYLSELERD